MAVDTPPFGAGRSDVAAIHECGAKDRAVGDPSAVNRCIGADNYLADKRVDSVTSNERVRRRLCAILELQRHLSARLIKAHKLFVEMNSLLGDHRGQSLM